MGVISRLSFLYRCYANHHYMHYTTMYRRAGGPVGSQLPVVTTKPPKPPCWLDLKTQNPHSFSDEGGSKCSPVNSQGQTLNQVLRASTGKAGKRNRAKIHRTRSQYCIDADDLPDCDMTISLAETDPKDIGLRKQVSDGAVFMQETTRKCQNWLQSLEECGPPDAVTSVLDSVDSESVDVEVPDDTLWYDDPKLRPPQNDSETNSDAEQTTCHTSKSNLHRSQSNLKSSDIKNVKGAGRKYQYSNILSSTDLPIIQ